MLAAKKRTKLEKINFILKNHVCPTLILHERTENITTYATRMKRSLRESLITESYTGCQVACKTYLFSDVGYRSKKQKVLRKYRSQQLNSNAQTKQNRC